MCAVARPRLKSRQSLFAARRVRAATVSVHLPHFVAGQSKGGLLVREGFQCLVRKVHSTSHELISQCLAPDARVCSNRCQPTPKPSRVVHHAFSHKNRVAVTVACIRTSSRSLEAAWHCQRRLIPVIFVCKISAGSDGAESIVVSFGCSFKERLATGSLVRQLEQKDM